MTEAPVPSAAPARAASAGATPPARRRDGPLRRLLAAAGLGLWLAAGALPSWPAAAQEKAPQEKAAQEKNTQERNGQEKSARNGAAAPAQARGQDPAAPATGAGAGEPDAEISAREAARLAAEARAAAVASASESSQRARAQLAAIEGALARRNHTRAQLDELRERLAAVTADLQQTLAPLTQRAAAAKALLDQLGPKPDEKKDGPETPEAAAERESRLRAHSELAETVKVGNALLLHASQLSEAVNSERRSTITHALFDRAWSILSPQLWMWVAGALPDNLRALGALGGAWLETARARYADGRLLPFGLSLAAFGVVWLARRLALRRLRARSARQTKPGPLRRAAVGLLSAAGDVAAVALCCWLLYLGVEGSNLAPGPLEELLQAAMAAVVILALAWRLLAALLAPAAPQWRVIDAPDHVATAAARYLFIAAALVLAGRLADTLLGVIGADHATVAATRGVGAAAVALTLVAMLRRIRDAAACDEHGLGPYVPPDSAVPGMWRLAGWAVASLTLLAAAAGYVALATFITEQSMWTLLLFGVTKLLLPVIDHGVGGLFADNSRLSVAMQTAVGVRKRSLNQIAVALAGALRLAVIVTAALLALAPLGVDSGDFAVSLRNLTFGLSVAGLNISPGNILTGAALLGAGVLLTRAFQGWLRARFLPTTSLDAGLRNSITTAAGYLGFFIAIAATLAHFGLSLDRIAIVAGALSVGIGFGLQSIVNNFVSGLILLWDRSISVGDWIVVGSEQGHVKRISIRATEIQTFERASIIVPNSTLVSGTVKNWLRNNRTGRISITVQVGYQQDPEAVSRLLLDCARAHPDVLREPAPSVLFTGFTATTQDFELRCFCDVESMSRIRSELNYRLFRALTDAGVYAPPRPAPAEVRVLPPDDLRDLIRARLAGNGDGRGDGRAGAGPDDAPQPPVTAR
ncbi:DUF3772 domain-containing protein [Camelimonas abortus]|uniref:DUF3772 domain-containing protein n=1 Tax=Camelimonas abortus TaxID=1017184 RepID=A0ABV7LB60_9HYPH